MEQEERNKHIQEIKDMLEKDSGKEVTWDEAEEAMRNLTGLAEILYDHWVEDQRRKKRLLESPKGFVLDGVGYTCFICGSGTKAGENWYDKWGIKCTTCQKAIDRKEIPGSLAKFKDSWYSKWELESRFNLKTVALKKWIKEGIIKARTVTGESGRPHVQLFLIKDNKDFLPPKKMTESHLVREEKDGQTWHRSEPWYRFVDPHEHLKGYRIMDYLRVVEAEK